ncbi:MAG: DMT family transporter [Roseivivax sp.]|nr:DMT family transporter [Roseivivax sp.]
MHLFLLTALTMIAFAANSVLNRLALAGGGIDAVGFGAVRLAAGAAVLLLMARVLRGHIALGGPRRAVGVAALLLYIFGFSFAYRSLDAGLGALVLFGTVQITMIAGALICGERPGPLRWLGAALAFAGLVWLLAPAQGGVAAPGPLAAMVAAGVGWGLYSLAGRGAGDALMATAANFALATPMALLLALLARPEAVTPSAQGLALAVLSGAVTSGLGYALWYTVLPRLQTSVAAVAQLTVPAIAMAGGMVFLGENMTARFLLASALILGGVAMSALAPRQAGQRTMRSNGS